MQLHDLPREFFRIKTFAVASRIRFSLIISETLNWSTETVTTKAGMCSLKWQSQSIFLEVMNFQMERQNTFGRTNTVRPPNFLPSPKNQHQDSDWFESSLIILCRIQKIENISNYTIHNCTVSYSHRFTAFFIRVTIKTLHRCKLKCIQPYDTWKTFFKFP